MDTLYLPLKKEWFEKIASGEKTTEFREVKPYWIRRLRRSVLALHRGRFEQIPGKIYDRVCFSLGYGGKTMTFEIADIYIVNGKDTDLAIEKPVYAIKLGRRLTSITEINRK